MQKYSTEYSTERYSTVQYLKSSTVQYITDNSIQYQVCEQDNQNKGEKGNQRTSFTKEIWNLTFRKLFDFNVII